ncbi:MAG: phosphatidate cytidylyltransferase [Planctomycetales bacterium]
MPKPACSASSGSSGSARRSTHKRGTPWFFALCYGFCLGVIGLIGDLCESLIKRDLGKKDSASLFPGFGGLLDILDSVIYSAPVAYLLWIIFPLGKDLPG